MDIKSINNLCNVLGTNAKHSPVAASHMSLFTGFFLLQLGYFCFGLSLWALGICDELFYCLTFHLLNADNNKQ